MMRAHKKKNFSTFLIVCVSLVIGFLAGYLAGFRYGIKQPRENFMPAMPQQFPTQASRIDLGSEAIKIVEELNCICGCKMELLPCTCDEPRGSREIKQFVQRMVNQGLSKPKVIERVVEIYSQDILIKKSS